MIELYVISFVAGVLTVLAPCILPLLPIIVGGSSVYDTTRQKETPWRPVIITASLVVSVILFTLLLKFTTVLLGIPTQIWSLISGGIIFLFGINLLQPRLWEWVMIKTSLQATTSRLMGNSQKQHGVKRDILLGAALGPVFNSCSPTYALIVAVLLPASFVSGLGYLSAYALGLGAILLLIAIIGRSLVVKLSWAANPHGVFQKSIGALFLIVGFVVMIGLDKHIQTAILDSGLYDPVMRLEEAFQKQ